MSAPLNPFPPMVGLAGRIRLVASRLAAASANDAAVELGDIAANVARLEARNVELAKEAAARHIADVVEASGGTVLPWRRPGPLGRNRVPANGYTPPDAA